MSLTDEVYNQIRTDILSCDIEPGSHISQKYLSNKYNVGKSPINSALQKLIHDKLIQSIPRSGYIVSPITVRDVNELFEVRLFIEVNVAALAVKRSSNENLKRIMDLSEASYVYKDRNSYHYLLERNKDFHVQIAQSAENYRLRDILTKIIEDLNRIFYLELDSRDTSEERRNEHRDLAIALCNRDISRVIELSRQQIIREHERVMDALSIRGAVHNSSLSLQDLVQVDKNKFEDVIPITFLGGE